MCVHWLLVQPTGAAPHLSGHCCGGGRFWLGWQRAAPARRYEAGFRWSFGAVLSRMFSGNLHGFTNMAMLKMKKWLEHVEDVGTNSVFNWSQVPSPTLTPTEDPYFFVFLPGIPVGRRCHWCSGGSLGCCESFRSLWCGRQAGKKLIVSLFLFSWASLKHLGMGQYLLIPFLGDEHP